MADAQTVAIVAMLLTLSVVAYLELRYMRRRHERREKADELPDRAHNAIITTKAIAEVVGRGGVRSEEALELIREAEAAARERNYRVAIELADKAKSILRTAKQKHHLRGDLAKLDEIGRKASVSEEITTKEKLTKELPPNLGASRFTIGLAKKDIAAARERGVDTTEAEEHLSMAQGSFEVQHYDAALQSAIRARRALEGGSKAPPSTESKAAAPAPAAPVAARVCSSCGANLGPEDAFCRKCGVKAELPSKCTSCGAAVTAEDGFCRACGAKVGNSPVE